MRLLLQGVVDPQVVRHWGHVVVPYRPDSIAPHGGRSRCKSTAMRADGRDGSPLRMRSDTPLHPGVRYCDQGPQIPGPGLRLRESMIPQPRSWSPDAGSAFPESGAPDPISPIPDPKIPDPEPGFPEMGCGINVRVRIRLFVQKVSRCIPGG